MGGGGTDLEDRWLNAEGLALLLGTAPADFERAAVPSS